MRDGYDGMYANTDPVHVKHPDQVVPKAVDPLALRTVDEALATMMIRDLDTGATMTMDMASGLMVPINSTAKETVRGACTLDMVG